MKYKPLNKKEKIIGGSLKITQEELKSHLNALYKDNKILVRKGINQKLIYPYGK